MIDRKKKQAPPSLEPLERREVPSGLMIALQAPVPTISPAQAVSIATGLGQSVRASQAPTDTNSPNGVYIGAAGPNASATFPTSPILGDGTPTAAELAREKFVARFSGPSYIRPGRFTDQEQIVFLRGLGGSTANFFLHADYSLAIVIPTDPTKAATGFAFLDDKNNNSGGQVGLDLLADPTSYDSKGRPTRLTFTADPNVYGGIFFVDSASGTVHITYGKDTATAVFNGRIYTSGLTNPLENVDLYAEHNG